MDPVMAGAWFAMLELVARSAVAVVFVLAAVGKLADLPGTRATLYLSRVTRPWVPQLTVALPAVELLLAAGLLGARASWYAAALTVLLLVAFIAYLALDPSAGQGCNCFGRSAHAPGATSRRRAIGRDVLLVGLLVPGLIAGPGGVRLGVPADLEPPFGLAALLGTAVALGAVLRSDRTGRSDRSGRADRTGRSDRSGRADGSGRRRAGTPPVPPVVVRREAVPFEVAALDGGRLTPAAGTTLLFTEPGCGLCAAVLPLAADRADVVVLVAGSPDDAAAVAARHGLAPARVGIDPDGAVADAYDVPGTPAACRIGPEGILVDAAGAPTTRPAVGADAVERLLTRTRTH